MSRRFSAVALMLALTFSVAAFAGQSTVSAWPGGRPSASPSWGSKPVPPRPPQPKIIMTGFDSITEDVDNNAYRDELSAMLPILHEYRVTAKSGSRCTQWVDQMSTLLNLYNPAVVLINCGTNDPTDTLEDRELLGQSYRQIIETIHELLHSSVADCRHRRLLDDRGNGAQQP
jgi:hypothetical protein